MLNPFSYLEKILYTIRDLFWDYPDALVGDNAVKQKISKVYTTSAPYSHFIFGFIVLVVFTFLFFGGRYKTLVNASEPKFIEAVVMGTDPSGRVQSINKVNPLLPSNIQIEKDLVELIYEPLIKYEYIQQKDGSYKPTIKNILASDVVRIKEGADYQFDLKKGVKWHDGSEFTADDVIATFNVVSKITKNENAYTRAIKQLRWEKLDKYSIRLCTKGSNPNLTCNQIENQESPAILSNFLELISIKIIPASKTSDINENTLDNFNAELFRSPDGTGKYKFYSADPTSITLVRNDDYLYDFIDTKPQIATIQFKFYKTLADSVQAIQNGEAHGLASISVEYKKDLESFTNVKVNTSPVLDNQYWGIYFNLKKDPNGKPSGPAFFTDSNNVVKVNNQISLNNGIRVREAISSAIDRSEVIQNALLGVGEEAFGPITQRSEFFNKNAGWYTFNKSKAAKLLDDAGWTLKPGHQFRINSKGEEMSFSLYFVNSYDRLNVAKVIQKDLADIGVNVIIDRRQQPGQDNSENAPSGWSLDELNREVLAPRSFDAILYGINTFIDPDRFEIFDSQEMNDPGLNISSYVSSYISLRENLNNKSTNSPSLVPVPFVDKLLEDARGFDPEKAKNDRKKNYNEFQVLIAQDAPVVFLYHPQFIYYTNVNLQKIDFTNVNSVEDRFRNIENWKVN